MSTHSPAPRPPLTAPPLTAPPLTARNKVGLGLAGLLGVGHLTGPLQVPAVWAANEFFDGPNNSSIGPAAIGLLVATATLGLVTAAGVVYTWLTASRIGARVVAGAQVISVLAALPVFLIPSIPAWVVLIAAASVVATIAAVILVLSRPAAPSLPRESVANELSA